jgi:hypothetical protein
MTEEKGRGYQRLVPGRFGGVAFAAGACSWRAQTSHFFQSKMDHGKILVDIPICANRNPQCLHDFASQIVFFNGFMMIFMYIACPFLAMDFSIFCKANPVVMFFMAP